MRKTVSVDAQSRCSVSESGLQDDSCNSRVDFIRELLMFGKDVKIFLQLAIADKSCYNAKKDNI